LLLVVVGAGPVDGCRVISAAGTSYSSSCCCSVGGLLGRVRVVAGVWLGLAVGRLSEFRARGRWGGDGWWRDGWCRGEAGVGCCGSGVGVFVWGRVRGGRVRRSGVCGLRRDGGVVDRGREFLRAAAVGALRTRGGLRGLVGRVLVCWRRR